MEVLCGGHAATDSALAVVQDAMEAARDAHAICVLTEWDRFKNYDYQAIYDNMVKPAFIFDGRNILDHAKLRCVGRPQGRLPWSCMHS